MAHDHDLREEVIQELLRFERPLVMIPRRAAQAGPLLAWLQMLRGDRGSTASD